MASPIVEKIQKIPTKMRAIGFGVLVVILLSVYVVQFQIPMKAQIDQLEKSLSELQAKIQSNDQKIKKLDELKSEVKTLQVRLAVLTEQLPPESEVSTLLRQIQNLVNQSGLVLKLWRPEKRRMHQTGLYEEIPITVTLTGGYHNTVALFDRIGKLTRIVNVLNIKMGSPKIGKDNAVDVDVNCTAMTFSAVVKKSESAPATGKKKVQ